MQHYFVDFPLHEMQTFTLPDDIYHHFVSVLRSKIGDKCEIVDINEQNYITQLVSDKKDENNIKVMKLDSKNVELPYDVSIICGIPKKEKAEWIVQKATEMGAKSIIFVDTDWSIAKWKGNKVGRKLERLNKIAKSAAEQSHRNIIPKVQFLNSIKDIDKNYNTKILAYEESAKSGEKSALKTNLEQLNVNDSIAAFFGPEGGISPKEVACLNEIGFINCGLGSRILRAETAPLYFLAALSFACELK
ncbi:16S rRNA (uracil(1498)-N(3))-methyltransferase [Apilactobacillus sp. TMW 2.2459]|uniref:16S rRNA (uracil(1498)-N(3))-methyltransferase n=1 Tax=Apilactobacillus xinyiensis TaxID=2841032 RepID=UPI00200CA760|nr:16S rRNA (uracil(1498)-N(3))-methyltransferase [Apilactobacillus xinyiensis]MCL0311638.1 16S rRNA (uracil(1498)-N(3))-methyltransferase [Apilactobacillus xinyiensis]